MLSENCSVMVTAAADPCRAEPTDDTVQVELFYNGPLGLGSFRWADDFDDERLARLAERRRREEEETIELTENPSCSEVEDISLAADHPNVRAALASASQEFSVETLSEAVHAPDGCFSTEKGKGRTPAPFPSKYETEVCNCAKSDPEAEALAATTADADGVKEAADVCVGETSHHFTEFTARDGEYHCKHCRSAITLGNKVHGCSFCPYDLCHACHGSLPVRAALNPTALAPELAAVAPVYVPHPPTPPPMGMGSGGHAIEPIMPTVTLRPPTTYGHKKARRALKKRGTVEGLVQGEPLPYTETPSPSEESASSEEGKAVVVPEKSTGEYRHSPYSTEAYSYGYRKQDDQCAQPSWQLAGDGSIGSQRVFVHPPQYIYPPTSYAAPAYPHPPSQSAPPAFFQPFAQPPVPSYQYPLYPAYVSPPHGVYR